MTIIRQNYPNSIPTLIKKAQTIFNTWIRKRDQDKGCISCGGPVQEAGHYYSAGHHGGLRFNEMNVHGQCTRCNCFLHGNLINYRASLISRIGQQNVDLLAAACRRPKKWSRTELTAIIYEYRVK
jgi:hypothetical protein